MKFLGHHTGVVALVFQDGAKKLASLSKDKCIKVKCNVFIYVVLKCTAVWFSVVGVGFTTASVPPNLR